MASIRAQRSGLGFGSRWRSCSEPKSSRGQQRSRQKEMSMADLPFPWCIYAKQQSKAAQCGRITDRSWGIENGLTKFLKAVESGSVPQNQAEFQRSMDRAVATGSWVERNHSRLRMKYLRPQQEFAERRVLARVHLAEIRNSMSAAEWGLLLAVAAGVAYHKMKGMTAGSARTKVARLRARLRQSRQEQGPYGSPGSRCAI